MYLGTRPEICRSFQAMVDHGLPQGLAEPPLGLVAAHGEGLAGVGIEKVVVDNAVKRRVKTGDNGVVVRES